MSNCKVFYLVMPRKRTRPNIKKLSTFYQANPWNRKEGYNSSKEMGSLSALPTTRNPLSIQSISLFSSLFNSEFLLAALPSRFDSNLMFVSKLKASCQKGQKLRHNLPCQTQCHLWQNSTVFLELQCQMENTDLFTITTPLPITL